MNEEEHTHIFDSDFLPALRVHCVAALMAAEREQAPASVIVLLTNVFAGLAHRGWELLNRGDAPQDLAMAIADFAAVVPTLSPEFGATERRQSPVADEDLVFAIGKTDDECHDGIAPTMTDSL